MTARALGLKQCCPVGQVGDNCRRDWERIGQLDGIGQAVRPLRHRGRVYFLCDGLAELGRLALQGGFLGMRG